MKTFVGSLFCRQMFFLYFCRHTKLYNLYRMKKIFYYALCAMLCFSCSTDDSETDDMPVVETEEVGGTGSGEGAGTEGEEEPGTGNGSESGSESEEGSGTVEGEPHDYVDLGLSSGTLWATCNVGANSPEEYGDYFAWGETEPKSKYNWSTYKYGSDDHELTKYCTYGYFGVADNNTILDPSDDAAVVNWGSAWRMPTLRELDELIKECTWTWTTLNGVNGHLVIGPNSNSIFLPAAGRRFHSDLSDAGSYGHYWSSALDPSFPCVAYSLDFGSGYVKREDVHGRIHGFSVRPVRASAQ